MFNLMRTYKHLLSKHPFITNVLTSCTFMTVGDLTSQRILQRDGTIDLNQTGRFLIAGLIYVGPGVRGCLVMIERLFGPTTSVEILAKKLVVDQLICAPLFLVGSIATLTYLDLKSIGAVKQELNRSYVDILRLNYCYWPFVQIVNYYYIPMKYRVLFGSTAALVWTVAFSFKLNQKEAKPTK